MYEDRYLKNIKKLYKSTVKYDDGQQYKAIIESSMVSNPELFIDNSPMPTSQFVTVQIQEWYNHSVSL